MEMIQIKKKIFLKKMFYFTSFFIYFFLFKHCLLKVSSPDLFEIKQIEICYKCMKDIYKLS